MKWTKNRSGNVDDRRGKSGGGGKLIGGGVGTIVIALIVYFLGGDPATVQTLTDTLGGTEQQTTERQLTEGELQIREFISMLTRENEVTWERVLTENGMKFRPATVVLFEETTQSGCGTAQSAMGPFYCPADEKIYMDMSFFGELERRFGAKATEFTVAYVLAHEFGHHIQHIIGMLQKSRQLEQQGYPKNGLNGTSVAVELQADFFAGLWAKKTDQREGILTPGDIESAMEAAAAVGDDNIQKRSRGSVNQDSFTHGSSKQRVEWFMKGYETGDIRQGDTFSALVTR